MLIDWFTVGAQLVNFLVLIWLLKRFAFKPILNAIDAREKRIVGQQTEASTNDAAARALGDELRRKTAAFDADLAAMKLRTAAEVGRDRDQQLTQSRQYGEQLRATERLGLLAERRSLGERLRRIATDTVFDSVRSTLNDLGGVALDERILVVFSERLRNLDTAAKSAFSTALAHVPAAAVRTRFALTDAARRGLQQTVDGVFGMHVPLEFTTEPAILGGIEMSAGGQKLSWSVADYLQSLNRQLDVLLPAAAPTAAPVLTAAPAATAASAATAAPSPAPTSAPSSVSTLVSP